MIEDAKAKRNLVVEGPRGTGKSQTITNIIAEFLAAGKSILFVSEKMAALEVVKDRLDQTGLGDFCLELHSRKANKKRVLEKLRRSMETSSAQPVNFEQEFFRLETLKTNLNSYTNLTHSGDPDLKNELIQPEVMQGPVGWLASEASDQFNGQRIIAYYWDESLPLPERLEKCSAPAAWPQLGRQSVRPNQ